MSDAPSLSRRRRNLLLALGVGIALFLALGRLGAGALIEVLWFSSLGYSEVFWRRVLSGAALRVLAIAGATWVIFLNLRAVARSMGRLHIRRRFGNLEIVEQLPPKYLFWILVGSSALLGIWFGFSVPGEAGVRILVWLNAGSWGVVEPIFGKDLGFFVFALPLLSALAGYSLVLVFLLFALSVAGYMATGALGFERGRFRSDPAAFRHLALLVGAFLVGVGAQLWLSRYGLLLDGTGVEGMFGFTDHRARLPALTTLSIVAVFAGGMVGWSGYSGRRRRGLAAVLLLVLGGVGLGQLLPALVQRFQVEPN